MDVRTSVCVCVCVCVELGVEAWGKFDGEREACFSAKGSFKL